VFLLGAGSWGEEEAEYLAWAKRIVLMVRFAWTNFPLFAPPCQETMCLCGRAVLLTILCLTDFVILSFR
jgi:hypothetical protein